MSNGRVVIDVAPQNRRMRMSRDIAGIGLADQLGRVYRERGYDVEYWFALDYMTREVFEESETRARRYLSGLNDRYGIDIDPAVFVDETRIKDIPDEYEEYLQPFIGALEEVEPVLEKGKLSCTAAETVMYRNKVNGNENTICITGYPESYGRLYRRGYRNVEAPLSEQLGVPIFSFIYPANSLFNDPLLDAVYSLYYIYHDEHDELDKACRKSIINTVSGVGYVEDGYARFAPRNRDGFINWVLASIRNSEKKFFSDFPEALRVANMMFSRELNGKPTAERSLIDLNQALGKIQTIYRIR